MIIRFKAGVLPVALDTGRFKNIPIVLRTCKVSMKDVTKDEYHFIFECETLENERECMKADLAEFFNIAGMDPGSKLKRMLQQDCVKTTARHLITMFDRR